jgi:hypothetical protein
MSPTDVPNLIDAMLAGVDEEHLGDEDVAAGELVDQLAEERDVVAVEGVAARGQAADVRAVLEEHRDLVAVDGELVGDALAPAPARPAAGAPPPRARIGLVFDVGGKDDHSFNDVAWRGLVRARDELGVERSPRSSRRTAPIARRRCASSRPSASSIW